MIQAKFDALSPVAEDPSMVCLSDQEVLDFANGTLASARHAEAHSHLDRCEICQRVLSEAAHALATGVSASSVESEQLSWHTTFQPGTLVGHRYLIRHFIARGGMGEVYEAFDRELQERVALKTVTSTACDNAGAVRRLKAEVQLARRVSHPNVCRIYDFGTHVMADGGGQISFLTMEFVEGETLGQRVRLTGALPIAEARALGRQLLGGLSAAHEAGVLHRDFKSDNVMLRAEPDGSCSPLILDFGLARTLDAGSRSESGSHSNLLGTFDYIAPEQLEGRAHTTASDVYSFGLVWYEMLTGGLPFDAPSTPVSKALARLQGPVAAPSSKNPLVSSDLDAVVLGCLRRSPKDRYRTAREVLNALDAHESRARSTTARKRLLPLCLGVIVGGVAAYAATIPPKASKPQASLSVMPSSSFAPRESLPAVALEPIAMTNLRNAASPPPATKPGKREPPRDPGPKATRLVVPNPTSTPPKATPTSDLPAAAGAASIPPARREPEVLPAKLPRWENPFDVRGASANVGGGGP